MAYIKNIKVGSVNCNIVPEKLVKGDYTAACPTLTSNTTAEIKTNFTTTISSSSTNNQYPSAKAVYDYIKSVFPDYVYTQSGSDVTLYSAPYSQSGDTVTIL